MHHSPLLLQTNIRRLVKVRPVSSILNDTDMQYAIIIQSEITKDVLLWTPAQRSPLSVAWAKSIIFCQCFYLFFFMAALFSGPG